MNDRRKRNNPAQLDISLLEFDFDLSNKERKLLDLGEEKVRNNFEEKIKEIKNFAVSQIVGTSTQDTSNEKLTNAVLQAYQFLDNNEIGYNAQTFLEVVSHYYGKSLPQLIRAEKDFINELNRQFVRDEVQYIVNDRTGKETPYYTRHIKEVIGLPIVEREFSKEEVTDPKVFLAILQEIRRISLFLTELPIIPKALFEVSQIKNVSYNKMSDQLFINSVAVIGNIIKSLDKGESKTFKMEKWNEGKFEELMVVPVMMYVQHLIKDYGGLIDDSLTNEILQPLIAYWGTFGRSKERKKYDWFDGKTIKDAPTEQGKLSADLFSLSVSLVKEYWNNKGTSETQYFNKGYVFRSIQFGNQNMYQVQWNVHLPHYCILQSSSGGEPVINESTGKASLVQRKVYYSDREKDNKGSLHYFYAINVLQDIFTESILNTEWGRDKIQNAIAFYSERKGLDANNNRLYAYDWVYKYIKLNKNVCPNFEDGLYIRTSKLIVDNKIVGNKEEVYSLVDKGIPTDADALNISVFDFDTRKQSGRINSTFSSFKSYFLGKSFYQYWDKWDDRGRKFWAEVTVSKENAPERFFKTYGTLDGLMKLIAYPTSEGMQLGFGDTKIGNSFPTDMTKGEFKSNWLSFFNVYGINFRAKTFGFKPTNLYSDDLKTMEAEISDIEQYAKAENETGIYEKTISDSFGKMVNFFIPANISPKALFTSVEEKKDKNTGKIKKEKVFKAFTIAQINGLKRAKKIADKERNKQLKQNLEFTLNTLQSKFDNLIQKDFNECKSRFDDLMEDQFKGFSYKDAMSDKRIVRAWQQIKYSLSSDTLELIKKDNKEGGRFEESLVAKTAYFVKGLDKYKFKEDQLGKSFDVKEARKKAKAYLDSDTPSDFDIKSDKALKYIDLGNLIGKFVVYRDVSMKEEIDFESNAISLVPNNEVYLFLFTELKGGERKYQSLEQWLIDQNRSGSTRDRWGRYNEKRKNPLVGEYHKGDYVCGILQSLAKSGFFFDYSDATHGKNTTDVGMVFDFQDIKLRGWEIKGGKDERPDYKNFRRFLGRYKPKDIFPTSIEINKTSGFASIRKHVIDKLIEDKKISTEQFDEVGASKGIYLKLKHIPTLCNALDQKGLYDLSIALRILFMDDPTFRSCTEQGQLQGKAFIDQIVDEKLQKKVRDTTKGLKAKDGIIMETKVVDGVSVKVPKLDKRNKPIHFKPYPYQKIGIYFAKMLEFKCLIGDDMGLGKTVQAMCSIKVAEQQHKANPSKYPSPFPCVVVAPAGVAPKWVEKELNVWFPEYNATLFSTQKVKDKEITKDNKVIVTSYNGLYLNKDVFDFWINLKPNMFIFDEAHRIKNYRTTGCMYAMIYMGIQLENKQLEEFLAVESLDENTPIGDIQADETDGKKVILWDINKYGSIMENKGKFRTDIAPYRILLTGTPIENKYQEAYVILRLLNPEKFQNYQDFNKRFNPTVTDSEGITRTDLNILKLLKAELDCVMIRRFKKEVFVGKKGEDFYFPTKDRFPLMVQMPDKARRTYDLVADMLVERMKERRLSQRTELAAKWFLGTVTQKEMKEVVDLFYKGEKKKRGDDIQPNKDGQRLLGSVGRYLGKDNGKLIIEGGKVVDKKNNRSFFIKKDLETAVGISNDTIFEMSGDALKQLVLGIGMNAKMDLVRIVGKAKVQSASIFIDKFFNKPDEFVKDYYLKSQAQELLTDISDHIDTYRRKADRKELQLVVFIKHKSVSEQLEQACTEMGLSARIVAGDKGKPLPNGVDERTQNIDDFQSGLFKVLIGSKAIREGINLYSANHMLFAELWWIPTQMEQAEDRIWRIGQQNPCSIFYLIGDRTVDVDVYQTLEQKRGLITSLVGMEEITKVIETENQVTKTAGDILSERFLGQEEAKKAFLEELGRTETTPALVADFLEIPLFLALQEPELARQYAKKRKIEKVLLFSVKKDKNLQNAILKINELLALSYFNAFKKVFGTEKTNYAKAGKYLKNNYQKYQKYPMDDVTWVTRREVDKKIIDTRDTIFYIFKIDISLDDPDVNKAYIDLSSVNLELCRKFYNELRDISLRISGEKRVKVSTEQQEFLERLVEIKGLWDNRELEDAENKRKAKEKLEKKKTSIATQKSNYVNIDSQRYTKEDALEVIEEKLTMLSEPTLANTSLKNKIKKLYEDIGEDFDIPTQFTRQNYHEQLNEIQLQGSSQYRTVYQLLRKQIEYSDPTAVFQSIPKAYIPMYLKKINSVLKDMQKLLFLE